MKSIAEDTRRAELKLITAKERQMTLTKEISSIESKIKALSIELDNKQAVVTAAKEEMDDMEARITYNSEKTIGLTIR